MSSDPRAISIDIETYGKCERGWNNEPLPLQQSENKKDGRFHPMRSLLQDGVPLSSLILTVSVTPVRHPPLSANRSIFDGPAPSLWSMANLTEIEPLPTMIFEMHRETHRRDLAFWLRHAHTLMGMNLAGFDIPYLRVDPLYRFLMGPSTHTIIDVSILNYLHSEVREARSLKTLGPVLGTHSYDPETPIGSHRFPSPTWKSPRGLGLHEYNGEDTHNVVLSLVELSRRILEDHALTDKLDPSCLHFYSHLLWSIVRLSESGIPMSRPLLASLRDRLHAIMEKATADALLFNLILGGEGSSKSKDAYINQVLSEVEASGHPSIRSHRLLKLTDKKKAVSWGDQNRILFQCTLPTDHPRQSELRTISTYSGAQKLIGSYITPLLDHQANDPSDRRSILLGSGPIGIGYPTIYATPSASKDGEGDSGGQQQGRISFKRPSAQTFPKPIKDCYASRFGPDGLIVQYDASQVELRGAALQSGEPSLINAFLNNEDLHSTRAISVFGRPLLVSCYGDHFLDDERFKSSHRQAAKHGNFTDLNWGSALALQRVILKKQNLLVAFDLCDKIVKSRASTRPILYEWQLQVLKEARDTGYVRLPLTGQSRTFTGLVQSDDTNEVVNFPIQCFAANITLRLQSFIDWRLPHPLDPRSRCFLFLNTYDALTFDVHRSYLPTLRTLMQEGIHWLTHVDLWALAERHYGRTCPLRYDESILSHKQKGPP